MKVLFLGRATLYTVYGGDTVQILSTAKYLRELGVEVDILLCNEVIDYASYDLLHIFNIIRPADALSHVRKSRKPYVVSTIFGDYTEYHKYHDRGVTALLNKVLAGDKMEYLKTIARWIKNGESVKSLDYLAIGHRNAVRKLAKGASLLLPNSESEYQRFSNTYDVLQSYMVIPNGIDLEIFDAAFFENPMEKDPLNVLCVARIEGKKNQLNLIKALNNTEFQLTIIGKAAPNHRAYFELCKVTAAPNVRFLDFIPMEQLIENYRQAKIHVLPSWNETTGLSSLEAAYAGCQIVITDKGDTFDYFGKHAFYCNPADPGSIYEAVKKASLAGADPFLKNKIETEYNWASTAEKTLEAYQSIL